MINIKVKESNRCNGKYSLYISFPYEPRIVDIIRSQVIRYWLPESKEWELPIKSFDYIMNDLKDYDVHIEDSNKILSNLKDNR